MRLRYVLRHALDAFARQLAGMFGTGPERADHLGGFRDDVVGRARRDFRASEHDGIEHIEAARRHGVERQSDLEHDGNGIDGEMRHRRVAALAFDRDDPFVGGGEHRSGLAGDGAGAEIGRDVEREGCVRFRIGVEKTVLDHEARAMMAFLARLEHELHRAREFVAAAMKKMHGLHQHCRVRVMSAGMHAAFELAREIETRRFRHRQRIHVPAQEDGAAALRSRLGAGQRHDQARCRRPAIDLHVEPLKPVQNRLRGDGEIEAELRLRMDAPAQTDGLRQEGVGFFEQMGNLGQDRSSMRAGLCNRSSGFGNSRAVRSGRRRRHAP